MEPFTCKAFKPAIGLSNRHIQTMYATFFRKPHINNFTQEMFELDDGDFVEAYWYKGSIKLEETHAIAILFHGLEGSFESPYIQGMMLKLERMGIPSVLMHFRGCATQSNRLARAYHSGDTADALAWMSAVHARYPKAKLFGIGYSLGGNMLLKLLGETKEHSPLHAAVSVSAPLQLDICANQMRRGFSKLYQKYLIRSLKSALELKYTQHNMHSYIGIHKNEIQKLPDFWSYDDVYTAPIHGFSSAKEYYERSSAKQYLHAITTPTLIIHAKDDPFMTPEILPTNEEISKAITMQVSEKGGHVGFVSGTLAKPTYWLEECISAYLQQF